MKVGDGHCSKGLWGNAKGTLEGHKEGALELDAGGGVVRGKTLELMCWMQGEHLGSSRIGGQNMRGLGEGV